jgi:colicin import membrane protein
MNRTRLKALLPLLSALALSACTDAAKAPAEQALQLGESAVSSLGEEIEKLAPDQVKAAREGLASAKAFAAKQDFQGALAAAKEIPAKAKAALDAAQAKKDQLAAEAAQAAAKAAAEARKAFDEAVSGASHKIEAIKAKLVTKGKALPKGMTKAAAKKYKAGLKELEDGLAKVKARAASDLAGATAEAAALQKKAAELARKLKVK